MPAPSAKPGATFASQFNPWHPRPWVSPLAQSAAMAKPTVGPNGAPLMTKLSYGTMSATSGKPASGPSFKDPNAPATPGAPSAPGAPAYKSAGISKPNTGASMPSTTRMF